MEQRLHGTHRPLQGLSSSKHPSRHQDVVLGTRPSGRYSQCDIATAPWPYRGKPKRRSQRSIDSTKPRPARRRKISIAERGSGARCALLRFLEARCSHL
jgi:hypothetical protein